VNGNDLLSTRSEAKIRTAIYLCNRFVGDIIENEDLSTEIARDDLKHFCAGVPLYFLQRGRVLIVMCLFKRLNCEDSYALTGKANSKVFPVL
jgi:hypothetical protein